MEISNIDLGCGFHPPPKGNSVKEFNKVISSMKLTPKHGSLDQYPAIVLPPSKILLPGYISLVDPGYNNCQQL